MQLYNKLREVASKHYPKEGGYCSVIATAVATGSSFGKARSMLYKHGKRVDGKGAYLDLIHNTLRQMGYDVRRLKCSIWQDMHKEPEYKAKTLISIQREFKNRKGTFFVYTNRHVTCIKDGVCEDWSNNEHGRPTKYKVLSVYEVIAND